MELGPYFCRATLDHSDVLLRRRYLRLYLSPARMVVLYTRVKFRPLPSSNDDDDTTPLYYYAVVYNSLTLFVSPLAIVLISLI